MGIIDMNLIPIEAATVRSEVIEDSGDGARPEWIMRGGKLPRAVNRNPFLNWTTQANVPVRIRRLRDIVLDADSMVLMTEQGVLSETKYMIPPERIASLGIDRSKLVSLDPGRLYVVCGDSWATNHYHFLSHGLPGIAAAVKFFGTDRLTLLHKPFPPSHARALTLLGLDGRDRIVLSGGAQYTIGDAVYCDYSAGIADFSASDFMAELHDRLGRACGEESDYGRLLYVSRLNTTHRRMVGEAELVRALSEFGFTILDPAPLNLDQQISAFRRARLVVGPHGAGMANVVFCSPGAEVYQLFPSHFDEPSIMVLSLRRGLAYWADAFTSGIDEETPAFVRDWQLDVSFALERVGEFTTVPLRRRLRTLVRRLVGRSLAKSVRRS